jgi:hypothetical protein
VALHKRDPTEAPTQPISAPAPRRRRGRPPVTPGEMKRYPLSLYVTKALKDQLVEASKASGRPLTGEIEARLQRTLEEDRPKDPRSVRIDALANEIKNLAEQCFQDLTDDSRMPTPVVIRSSSPARGEIPREPAVADDKSSQIALLKGLVNSQMKGDFFKGLVARHGNQLYRITDDWTLVPVEEKPAATPAVPSAGPEPKSKSRKS